MDKVYQLNDFESAFYDYINLNKKNHLLPGLHLSLGLMYQDRGDTAMAFSEFRKEIQVDRVGISNPTYVCAKNLYLVRMHHAYVLLNDTIGAKGVVHQYPGDYIFTSRKATEKFYRF